MAQVGIVMGSDSDMPVMVEVKIKTTRAEENHESINCRKWWT